MTRHFTFSMSIMKDFEGQKRAERVQHYLLISTTVSTHVSAMLKPYQRVAGHRPPFQVLSFVIGFVAQSLWVTFVILGTGTAAVALVSFCLCHGKKKWDTHSPFDVS
jgi:hypothetical protein